MWLRVQTQKYLNDFVPGDGAGFLNLPNNMRRVTATMCINNIDVGTFYWGLHWENNIHVGWMMLKILCVWKRLSNSSILELSPLISS